MPATLLRCSVVVLLLSTAAFAQDKFVTIKTDTLEVVFDAEGHGGIRALTVGKKTIVRDNAQPPLFGTVMESAKYDGMSDFVEDAKFIEGKYERVAFDAKEDGGAHVVTAEGKLAFSGKDAIHAQFTWTIRNGSPVIETTVQLKLEGGFTNRYIRELGIQLPTVLNERKRVVQGGDQGWQFDSRHRYEFFTDTTGHLMPEPDHNWWNFFAVEQDSPLHFKAWRAESAATPPEIIQHGHQAAGWIAEYDEQGGILAGYRDWAKRAPKALFVNAAAGGQMRVLLHSNSWKAAPPQSTATTALLFQDAHRIDWIPFEGLIGAAKPQAALAKAWGVAKLPSDPPSTPKLLDLDLWNAPAAGDENSPTVIGGLPLARGALTKPDAVRLFEGKREIPVQTKALAYWPDQSIKWLLLIYSLRGNNIVNGASKNGQTLAFNANLRNGKEAFTLEYGNDVLKERLLTPSAPDKLVSAKEQDGKIEIDTGVLHLTLSTGERWIQQIALKGKPLLREDATSPLAFTDFLRMKEYVTNTAHPSGEPDPGPVKIESMVLEEAGPLRAMVRLEGHAQCKEPPRIIIRLEAYAGESKVRVFHTVEFLHKDPRETFVRSMGLRLPLALDAATARISYGAQDGPKELPHTGSAGVLEASHLNYRAWAAEKMGAQPVVSDESNRCRGWLNFGDANFGCTLVMRHMWQEYPKELVADTDRKELTAYLWPESVPPMDMRRYSNYPHPSQGESADPQNWWVAQWFYNKEADRGPVYGVSKTHELLLWFHAPNVELAQIDAVAADFQSPPLVYVNPEYYAKVGFTFPYAIADKTKFPKIEHNLENITEFILFHQKLWAWYGMWDYGDIMHRYESGYGAVVKPEPLAKLLKLPLAERVKAKIPQDDMAREYFPIRDWAFDNGRWGWSNTEGLPGLFLQMAYLRSGRRDLYFAAEAMARHTRDVDMRHDGKYFGAGTRHGVQHWSDGDHEMRQTVASEWRFYHYLTGDMRCRDFLKQLAEKVFTTGRCEGSADHSGRLYGLLTWWEMTGDKKIGEMVEKYVHCFIIPEGIDIAPHVEFPEGKLYDPKPGDPNGTTMFFHTFGGMHALLEYEAITHDPLLKDAIIRMATVYAKKDWQGEYRKPIAFAVLNAPDPKPFREAFNKWINCWEAHALFQMVTENRRHWTGDTSLMVWEMPFTLFCLGDIFYTLPAFDKEPAIPAGRQQKIDNWEKNGQPHNFADGTFQSQYDRPEFKDFMDEKPWPKELGARK